VLIFYVEVSSKSIKESMSKRSASDTDLLLKGPNYRRVKMLEVAKDVVNVENFVEDEEGIVPIEIDGKFLYLATIDAIDEDGNIVVMDKDAQRPLERQTTNIDNVVNTILFSNDLLHLRIGIVGKPMEELLAQLIAALGGRSQLSGYSPLKLTLSGNWIQEGVEKLVHAWYRPPGAKRLELILNHLTANVSDVEKILPILSSLIDLESVENSNLYLQVEAYRDIDMTTFTQTLGGFMQSQPNNISELQTACDAVTNGQMVSPFFARSPHITSLELVVNSEDIVSGGMSGLFGNLQGNSKLESLWVHLNTDAVFDGPTTRGMIVMLGTSKFLSLGIAGDRGGLFRGDVALSERDSLFEAIGKSSLDVLSIWSYIISEGESLAFAQGRSVVASSPFPRLLHTFYGSTRAATPFFQSLLAPPRGPSVTLCHVDDMNLEAMPPHDLLAQIAPLINLPECSLQNLGLENIDYNLDGFDSFCTALRINLRIEELSLGGPMPEIAWVSLCQALSVNKKLKTLKVPMGLDPVPLRTALMTNLCLLDIPGNADDEVSNQLATNLAASQISANPMSARLS
jgi:hypothetical protein